MKVIPHRLFLEITTQCNLHCKLCKLWKQKDTLHKLNLRAKLNFLQKFIGWVGNFNEANQKSFSIILTGGEPFYSLGSGNFFSISSIYFSRSSIILCKL